MKKIYFQPTGMNRDISQHMYSPQKAYEIRNMRIMATDDQTTLALVNEMGTSVLTVDNSTYEGNLTTIDSFVDDAIIIGSARYEDYIVYFATTTTEEATGVDDFSAGDSNVDYIYRVRLTSDTTYELVLLYEGDMNFSALNPIQAVIRADTSSQVLLYWTDGWNEMSRLNIFADTTATTDNENEIRLLPKIPVVTGTVTKSYGSGHFSAGVIQYFATCFNRGGAESNIIWRSPIHYLTNNNWGVEAGTSVSCYFTITISQTSDTLGISLGLFDYVRIYSVIRTTNDGDGVAALIGTYEIQSSTDSSGVTTYSVTCSDTNDNTTAVDLSLINSLKYPIIAKTIQAKQDRLFFGGIRTMTNIVAEKVSLTSDDYEISFYDGETYTPDQGQLNDGADVVTTFRNREYYYFGIIAYNSYGIPSDVIPLEYKQIEGTSGTKITPKITLTSSIASSLVEYDIIKVEPVVVQGSAATRTIETQGWTNHTVFNLYDRLTNNAIMPSWFLRTSGYKRKLLWDQEYFYLTNYERMTHFDRSLIMKTSHVSSEFRTHFDRHIVYPFHGAYSEDCEGDDGDHARFRTYSQREYFIHDTDGTVLTDEEVGDDSETSVDNAVFTGVVSAGHYQSISYGWSRNCEVQTTCRIPVAGHTSGKDTTSRETLTDDGDKINYVLFVGKTTGQAYYGDRQ